MVAHKSQKPPLHTYTQWNIWATHFPTVCSLSSEIIHPSYWVLHTTSIILPAQWAGAFHVWFAVAGGRGQWKGLAGHTRMTILKRAAHCQGLHVAPSYATALTTDKQPFIWSDFPSLCNSDCQNIESFSFSHLHQLWNNRRETREGSCFYFLNFCVLCFSSVYAANKMLLWVGTTFPYINTIDCSTYSTCCHTCSASFWNANIKRAQENSVYHISLLLNGNR